MLTSFDAELYPWTELGAAYFQEFELVIDDRSWLSVFHHVDDFKNSIWVKLSVARLVIMAFMKIHYSTLGFRP